MQRKLLKRTNCKFIIRKCGRVGTNKIRQNKLLGGNSPECATTNEMILKNDKIVYSKAAVSSITKT